MNAKPFKNKGYRKAIGPLASYLPAFIQALSERGYKAGTISHYRCYFLDFSLHLHQRKIDVKHINERLIDDFFSIPHSKHYHKKVLINLLHFLRGEALLPPVVTFNLDLTPLESDFKEYLIREKGMSTPKSYNRYLKVSRDFISAHTEAKYEHLAALTAQDVTNFLLSYLHGINRKTAQLRASVLRNFLRFLYFRGITEYNLAKAIPRVANRQRAGLPKFIPFEQVELILENCNRNTAVGKRDYAILLLLARLGLRSKELISIKLDDVNWDAGELVVHGKGARLDILPLPSDVGEALAIYLHDVRPRCVSRSFFLCMNGPPWHGFKDSATVYSIVQSAFKRAKVKAVQAGPHILRHTLATRMLRQGASLSEIGEVLRHRSLNSTQIYAKVDFVSLRELGFPWPGGIE